MKSLVACVCDPCFHLLVVGLILLRISVGIATEAQTTGVKPSVECRSCGAWHQEGRSCPALVEQIDALSLVR